MKGFNEYCECGEESNIVENNLYRVGSYMYFQYFRDIREEYVKGKIDLSPQDLDVIMSDLGEFADFNGEKVALDCIFEEKDVELNKPKKGGPKKYYVYVKDPSTGNIKKVSWGDTTGLKVKIDDPEARKSFAARHKCDQQNDKTKASYWACRLPHYAKQLGLSGGGSFFW